MEDNLFNINKREQRMNNAPLAFRMRPTTLDDFAGQDSLLSKGKLLRRLIEADNFQSLIFFGPPGIGKTTLANVIANTTKSNFVPLNAVEAKTTDLREVIVNAKNNWDYYSQKTILFVDEIHRFNKSQQDVLLKDVEEGTIQLIGATTANPLYSLNSALVSRSRLFEFKPLSLKDMLVVLNRALHSAQGLGNNKINITQDHLKLLVKRSDGDLRQVLNNLELAVKSSAVDSTGAINISDETILEISANKILAYDENEHYDNISAFIKSMRASKEDEALHYLCRMLKGGEDLLFIARRMIIFASEDIGLANPEALQLALSVYRACEVIGMPECRINLYHGVTYLSRSSKDRLVYEKGEQAMQRVEQLPNNPVPEHLRNYKIHS